MIPAALRDKIEGFVFNAGREKVSGRMWAGTAVIRLGVNTLYLQLWHHGANEEKAENLVKHLTVRSFDGYDAYWHCLISENAIWFHEIGWFNDRDLEKQITGGNPNFYERTLKYNNYAELGFVRIWPE